MDPFWKTVWPDDWNDRRKDIDAILLIASEHASLDGILTAVTLDHSLDKKNDANSEKSDEKQVTISTIQGAKGLEWPVEHITSFIRGRSEERRVGKEGVSTCRSRGAAGN